MNKEENMEIRTLETFVKGVKEEGASEPCKYVQFNKEEAKRLLDYITNLQERCEYLERSNNRREDEIISLRDENVAVETYKSRINKAIEYITHEWFKREQIGISHLSFSYDELQHILDLLRGKDDDQSKNDN